MYINIYEACERVVLHEVGVTNSNPTDVCTTKMQIHWARVAQKESRYVQEPKTL